MKNAGEGPSLSEDLSRLLDGDLPEAEAACLRNLIASDPDVAALWTRMNALPGRIGALPRIPPPPGLNRRILESLRPVRSLRSRVFVPALAAVILLALVLARPDAPAHLVVDEGTTEVEGDVLAVAGGVRVRVDGRARISVEPSGMPVRERGAKEVPMNWTHGVVATGTAVLTVAVLSGTARIGEEGSELRVDEGGTWRSAPERSESVVSRPRTVTPSRDPVQARIDELEKELEGLRMQKALMQGRLASIEGVPQGFPEDLIQDLRAGGFDRLVADTFKGRDDVELLEVNCDEFPCFAVIRAKTGGEAWKTEIGETLRVAGKETTGLDLGLWTSSSAFGQEEGDLRLASVALIPTGDVTDEVRSRLGWRIDGTVASWKEDLGAE